MNLIILDPEEVTDGTDVHLTGRRAEHLRKILRAAPGDFVRVGVVDGPVGMAEVLELSRDGARLRCLLDAEAPPAGQDTLILAIARPKVMLRCLEHATALGFGKIALLRTKRVDKNHMLASCLDDATIDRRLRLGLEQSRRTALPRVSVHRRFRTFLEQELEPLATESNRFVAHQDSQLHITSRSMLSAPYTLVIGPEGGLLDFEVVEFESRGFASVHVGTAPLRVETALSFVAGHLSATRHLAENPA